MYYIYNKDVYLNTINNLNVVLWTYGEITRLGTM